MLHRARSVVMDSWSEVVAALDVSGLLLSAVRNRTGLQVYFETEPDFGGSSLVMRPNCGQTESQKLDFGR